MLVPPFSQLHPFWIDIGLASEKGRRLRNEDYVAAYWGKANSRAGRGVVAVATDGVGGHKGGREAAETAVRAFIDGYYNLPDALSVPQAAGRALDAVNGWIAAQARVDPQLAGMATTFTALVIAGDTGHVIHVGDTRVYRLDKSGLQQLTGDHTIDTGEIALALHRAVGFEANLRMDHATFSLQVHDRFLLCTDGVHGVLSEARLRAILGAAGDPAEAARKIASAALRAGSMDNASAIVLDIIEPRTHEPEGIAPSATSPEPSARAAEEPRSNGGALLLPRFVKAAFAAMLTCNIVSLRLRFSRRRAGQKSARRERHIRR